MNDAAVMAVWAVLKSFEERLRDLEDHVVSLEARVRARLKEEADERKLLERSGYTGSA